MRLSRVSLWKPALFIYLPSMLMGLGQGIILPALPNLGVEFGVSGVVAVQVITVQLAGRMIVLIPAGGVIDRWGTKPPMIVGAAVAAASGLLAALAPNFAVVLVTQFTWGMGMSTWMFGREVAAFDMVRVEQRGRQMSALMGIGSTGMVLGPAIGGVLTDTLGVRSLFYLISITGAVVLLISLAIANSGGRSTHSGGKLFNLNALKEIHPYFRWTYAILFFATFMQMIRGQITNTMMPLYTQEQLSYSATTTGFIFFIMASTTILMIVPTGFISDKLGRKWAAVPAALFSAVGFVVFPLAESLVFLIIGAAIIGLANGLAMGAMTIYTYDIVPLHVRGQLQAMRRTFGEFGAFLSPPIGGVLAAAYGPSVAFLAFAPLHAISAILLFFVARESLGKKLPSRPGDPTN